MASTAAKFPSFVVPLPREVDGKVAHEFFFIEWAFHDAPPPSDPSISIPAGSNPRISTILFTPLEEYKLQGSFATPFLVLTNYTELARTHNIVLLRGEITAGSAGGYLLTQEDAQLLAVVLQKFYLWAKDADGTERTKLLESFHRNPEQFDWQDLLKHAQLI